jgi:hypothetical protein
MHNFYLASLANTQAIIIHIQKKFFSYMYLCLVEI